MPGERSAELRAPIVSVIVPCHDVEKYLDECISSILNQSMQDLEVIAIDDGSTDGTSERLARWASDDLRLTVITQENAGLGSARNAGVALARGRYITFVDSDDLLPLVALDTMIVAGDHSGADLVTGVAERFDSTGRWRVAPYGHLFDSDRLDCHISRNPELVYDQMACAKLFSSEFWERTGLVFPEGVLYEDVSVVMQAQWEAERVAVVADTVYLWRRRENGALSITQDRFRPGSAAARFAALGRADRYLRDHATPDVWAEHGIKVCTVDLRMYARLLADAHADWAAELLSAAGAVLDDLSPDARDRLTWPMRVICLAVQRGDVQAVCKGEGLLSTAEGRSIVRSSRAALWLGLRRPRLLLAALTNERSRRQPRPS